MIKVTYGTNKTIMIAHVYNKINFSELELILL